MAASEENREYEMNTAYDHMSLEEEEEGGLIVEGHDVNDRGQVKFDFRHCLVGRFLTDKVINFPAMKNTMASLWRPGKGVCRGGAQAISLWGQSIYFEILKG